MFALIEHRCAIIMVLRMATVKLFLLVSAALLLTVECRLRSSRHRQRRQDWGLTKGWNWGNWYYYWYWRHGVVRATVSDKDTICQRLWNVDVNRIHQGVAFDLLPQTKVSQVSHNDNASLPLFKYLKGSFIRSRPTFRTFEDLLSNFEPSREGAAIVKTSSKQSQEKVEIFLKEVSKTRVFHELYWFLVRNTFISPNKTKFHQELVQIWFNEGHNSGLSGFHRIFVGVTVLNPDKISFRNWIQFYSLELNQSLNYYGYLRLLQSNPLIISPKFTWQGGSTVSDNMFVGTSPEFELALYTLCFYTNPGKMCECKLNTRRIVVKTIASINGLTLKNAFFEIKT